MGKILKIEIIEAMLKDSDWQVRQAAMEACKGRDIPLDVIERWAKDSYMRVRQAAMEVCKGRDIPLEVIERGLKDSDWPVRQAAMKACKGRDVPLVVIERCVKDSDWRVRQAAMEVCKGRDVPLEVIELGLKDSDSDVHQAAMEACKENGYPLPVIRSFDPPEKVYKKCRNGVIIVAEIPVSASVVGKPGSQCRASAAKILEVRNCPENPQFGISFHDVKTVYEVGDLVEIDNFDYSQKECSTGYHFFCSLEEAEKYG